MIKILGQTGLNFIGNKYKELKALVDKKADKSNISKCKARGYNTSNIWQNLDTERDLEDWIGDFDKRTRELKNSGSGGDFRNIEVPANSKITGVLNYRYFRMYKIGGLVCINALIDLESLTKIQLPTGFRPQQLLMFRIYADLYRQSTKVPYEENHSIRVEIDTLGYISSRFQTIDNAVGEFTIVFAIGN